MNDQPILSEALVEEMLGRRGAHPAPVGLASAIRAAVGETPQARRSWRAAALPAAPPMARPRVVRIVALTALLVAVALVAALVAGQALRQVDLPVVTSPSPSPTEAITSSAFGPITWRTLDTTRIGSLRSLAGTPYGPVGLTDDGLRWPAPDGTWVGMPLEGDGGLFPVDTRVIVGGSGATWLARSGSDWSLGEAVDLEGAMDVNDVVSGPRGIVVTDGAAIQVSTDGVRFVRAAQGPDERSLDRRSARCESRVESGGVGEGSIGPLLATDAGFIALTARNPDRWTDDPVCEPVLWQSADGSQWELVAPVSPFGPGASVRDAASRAGRHIAVGSTAPGGRANAVWLSDDGLTWHLLPALVPQGPCPYAEVAPCSHVLARVVPAYAGWVLLDYDGFAWTSTDGLTWQLLGWPGIQGGYFPQEVAFSPGSIVVSEFAGAAVIGTFEP